MKKTALIMLVLALYCCVCQAQESDNEKKDDEICDEDACMNAKFKYRFCDGKGNVVLKCSDDPNNERGLKLLKRRVPINYNYEYWTLNPEVTKGDDTISFYVGDELNYYEYPLFVGNNMKPFIQAAARRWSNLCPPQGPDDEYQDCMLTVRWSYPDEEIGSNFALTDYKIDPIRCELYCPGSVMILNQHPRFTQKDEYERPRFFIGTERNNYGYLPQFPPGKYKYMDAYTLVLHEFGHWLGFPHSDTPDDYGQSCGDPNGIMKAEAGNLEQQDLSWGDQCMFLKAYCCEDSQQEVPVTYDPRDPNDPPHDGTKTVIGYSEGFTVLPNPSRSGMLMLRLTLPEESGSGSVRLVDAAGRMALEQQLASAKGQEISLDISALPKGMYLVQVFFGDRAFSQKVVIE